MQRLPGLGAVDHGFENAGVCLAHSRCWLNEHRLRSLVSPAHCGNPRCVEGDSFPRLCDNGDFFHTLCPQSSGVVRSALPECN